MIEYKIEVVMTPHPWDNAAAPYFWSILKWGELGSWYNIGCGWSRTPKEAYIDAEAKYNEIKNNEEDK